MRGSREVWGSAWEVQESPGNSGALPGRCRRAQGTVRHCLGGTGEPRGQWGRSRSCPQSSLSSALLSLVPPEVSPFSHLSRLSLPVLNLPWTQAKCFPVSLRVRIPSLVSKGCDLAGKTPLLLQAEVQQGSCGSAGLLLSQLCSEQEDVQTPLHHFWVKNWA